MLTKRTTIILGFTIMLCLGSCTKQKSSFSYYAFTKGVSSAHFYSPSQFFKTTKIDLGTIQPSNQGKITAHFDYQNLTGETVVIKKVNKSCGCITVNYIKQPIKKNASGSIDVTIDIDGDSGFFEKSVLVHVSGIRPTILKTRGLISTHY